MSAETTRTRLLPAVLSVVGLFLIMIAIARLQGSPTFTPPEFLFPERDAPARPNDTPGEPVWDGFPQREPDPLLANILSNIGAVIGIAVAIAVGITALWLLVRVAIRVWSLRRHRRREGAALDVEQGDIAHSEEAGDAEVVQTGIAGALENIDDHADPGDAIIAAWVGLELSAERAGFVRSASETPSEFTRRIVSRAAGSAADVDTLLRLYERVRFGDYLANERDRIRAREALRRLREVRQ